MHPALGQVDLLLDVAGAALGGHGEARRIDVEPGAAVRPHPLQLAVQPGAEVDVGRAALEFVDAVEQLVIGGQPGIGALVARERLEGDLVRMDRDDRVEDVGELVLVLVDVVDVSHPRPVERFQPLARRAVELPEPGLEHLDPLADRLVLHAQAGEEGPVLLLEPGLEFEAIARAILEVADDHVIERRQALAERHRTAERAAEEGRLAERIRGQGDVRAVQAVDDPAPAVIAEGGDHATPPIATTTGDFSPG